ncbi:protein FANTASTIC FOUR 2-like [Abrus precatorius]|uniref:Protein FANTASTIC FOUR 2-like n=1 Tax=Abrus precatorius TaxID=3816 RepID=A0A8B8MHQ8_ABRPR|nr:protein FANTASTIC FOUR 2-like [Abrus precatorius]
MSYSSVCQGLQSSVEPRHIESRVLKLKLAPPGSNTNTTSPSTDPGTCEKPVTNISTQTPAIKNHEHGNKNSEPGGCNWSFLQTLSNISHCNKTEDVYVHPAVKRSSSMLSAKSLELCTESLGSETGSNAGDNSDDVSLFSLESSHSFRNNNNNTTVVNRNSESKRLNRGSTFPPPLTSMGGLQVRSHREDGRLILEAVTSSSPQPYFQAERGNGRLRLRLFESVASYYGGDDEIEGETLKQEAYGEEDGVVEEEVEEHVAYGEDEMGITMFVRPSTCKESGNRVIFGDVYFDHTPVSLCL